MRLHRLCVLAALVACGCSNNRGGFVPPDGAAPDTGADVATAIDAPTPDADSSDGAKGGDVGGGCATPNPAEACTQGAGACVPSACFCSGEGWVCTADCGGCRARACMPGLDQTCNDDPTISSLHGRCEPNGTCTCGPGFVLNPATGRCR